MGAKAGGQIVGYRYHIGMHLALCYGPVDKITRFFINDRVAWSGENTGGTMNVYSPNLFGGDEREGGAWGKIDIEMGDPGQGRNGYLVEKLIGQIPAYRGVCCAVLRRFYIGNNPYLKPMAFKLTRTQVDTWGDPIWYQAKADINSGDMNPAHIIYECLTNEEWGMGYPVSSIDDANFRSVADALYVENFGLSMQWNQQDTLEGFIGQIINHINGFLYVDPSTGKFNLKLVRADYSIDSLPLFDESNIVAIESKERRAWGETINEINLVYRDRQTNKDQTVTVQDIANIQFQGGIVSQTIQMPGIPNDDLATKVAFRELQAVSSPLARRVLIVNRSAWNLSVGDVFLHSWKKHGIGRQVFRVMQINTGNLTDGKIRITAVEDVFGMPLAVYVGSASSGWVNPSADPVDLTRQRVVEASYWDIQTKVCQADIAFFTSGFGFLVSMGSREAGANFGYRLLTKVGANPYTSRGTFPSCPSAIITEALVQEVETTFHYSGERDFALVDLNIYAYIEDEMVEIKVIDESTRAITVNRGVLDTVPVAHAAGQIIYFSEMWSGRDETEYTESDVVSAKLLEITGLGALDQADATELSVTMTNRYERPYAPGNFKIGGNRYPSAASGDLVLTWAHRDKTLQTAYLVGQTEGNIGPEPSTTYTVRIYDDATNTLKHTEAGLTGTTWTYTQATRITEFGAAGPHEVRVELESEISGLVSHQFHSNVLTVSDV